MFFYFKSTKIFLLLYLVFVMLQPSHWNHTSEMKRKLIINQWLLNHSKVWLYFINTSIWCLMIHSPNTIMLCSGPWNNNLTCILLAIYHARIISVSASYSKNNVFVNYRRTWSTIFICNASKNLTSGWMNMSKNTVINKCKNVTSNRAKYIRWLTN